MRDGAFCFGGYIDNAERFILTDEGMRNE